MNFPVTDWGIRTTHVGRRLHVFDELPSTNTHAAEHGEPGDAVIAYHQTAGRGRFDRVWNSRPHVSLLLSVVLAPPPELRRPSILTAWAAVGVAKAIEELGEGVRPTIKWPNDILIDGKKICGILIEQQRTTVVGIGLNLTQTADDFAAAGLPDATSLFLASGWMVGVKSAAQMALHCLQAEYSRLLTGDRAAVEADWKKRTGLIGKSVLVEMTDGTALTGRLRDMSFDGLEVETETGYPRVVVPETVAHVRAL